MFDVDSYEAIDIIWVNNLDSSTKENKTDDSCVGNNPINDTFCTIHGKMNKTFTY